MIRLLQKVQFRLQFEILAHDVGAVTAGENDFEIGPLKPQPLRQFAAIHVAGHHEVGEEQIDIRFVLLPDHSGIVAAAGLQNPVSMFLKNAGDEFAHGALILDEQNSFRAAAHTDQRRRFFRLDFFRADVRNINAKGRAFANGAFNFNPTLMLLDDAVNGGQPKAGAFADVFGGEKRFKNALKIFRFNPAAGICFC